MIMRRSSLTIGALALICTAGAAEAQSPKLGYINSQEILVNAPGAEAAQAAFDAEMAGYQNEIMQLETELQNLEAALQQQQLTLSPEARSNREQQLQAKFQEYQQRTGQLQEVANQRRAALIQPVMDNITAIIEELREEGSYTLILDAAAGSIVSADPAFDLTQEVIGRLQAADDPGIGPEN
ncbi:OmpH family outer membrane protein [Gemmatimonadales bacterium]|nr:OmpH family outer membrane protein [Gemmatimonadales bacterium]